MNVLFFLCKLGDFINCEEPIWVVSETDWNIFWLNIIFSALITVGSVIAGMYLNNWNNKRIIRNNAKHSVKGELKDILDLLRSSNTKNIGQTFDHRAFSYTPFRFEAIAYQSLIHSGSLLEIDGELQISIRDSYALIMEHNNLLSEIDRLVPNIFLHHVFNYLEYMNHIEEIQVNLTGLESELDKELVSVLELL